MIPALVSSHPVHVHPFSNTQNHDRYVHKHHNTKLCPIIQALVMQNNRYLIAAITSTEASSGIPLGTLPWSCTRRAKLHPLVLVRTVGCTAQDLVAASKLFRNLSLFDLDTAVPDRYGWHCDDANQHRSPYLSALVKPGRLGF